MNCPWNGRVWPMVNSHIAEALAHAAIRYEDDGLRQKTVEFITRFIHMMFHDGDPARPNCYEHYNPLTGKASLYRGVDDYQHSWVIELIVKYVCGIRPHAAGVVVDPFPFDVENVHIDGVLVRGRRLGVERAGERFHVWVDGAKTATSRLGVPIFLTF